MKNLADTIVEKIIQSKPKLPPENMLLQIAFKWNKEGLSTWDGGEDLNEEIRGKVTQLLEENFKQKDSDFRAILRFLIKQEIRNCYESEILTTALRICYDNLAELKYLEDIPLLLAANDDTSFDANCGLFKDRLFYNGYKAVMKYLHSNKEIDLALIEKIQYYAEHFGYDKE